MKINCDWHRNKGFTTGINGYRVQIDLPFLVSQINQELSEPLTAAAFLQLSNQSLIQFLSSRQQDLESVMAEADMEVTTQGFPKKIRKAKIDFSIHGTCDKTCLLDGLQKIFGASSELNDLMCTDAIIHVDMTLNEKSVLASWSRVKLGSLKDTDSYDIVMNSVRSSSNEEEELP